LDGDSGLGSARCVAGGLAESIFQPEWSPGGALHFVSDLNGWWNLYREIDGRIEPLTPVEAELGQPQWVFGLSRYAFMANGQVACIYSRDGVDQLGLIEVEADQVTPIPCEYTTLRYLDSDGELLWMIGGSPVSGPVVLALDPSDGRVEVIRKAGEANIPTQYFSLPRAIEVPTEEGQTVHALYYPPTSPDYYAPQDELPPLLVRSHGGPTSAAVAQLSLSTQYWTSRGFAVADVNYGGSTGYGREYRERLKGRWGIVDVMDCISVAQYLIDEGEVDPDRTAIRGGSAGGYTTLRALTWQDFFRAGASYYGVADLERLALDTHKFEARYLDGLIGPYPECRDLYRERSPLHSADRISCPVIILQGCEDRIVPPSQAEAMVEALQARGTPHAYLTFEGEQHGFRKAESITRAAEAELYFYSRLFGFDLPDDVEPVSIINL
jgi:dipeptidyl aminopeptidase/acylaminoacyl peptidase